MTSHSPASSPELPDLPKLPAAREFYGHDYVGDKIHAGMGFIDEDMEAYATAHGLACYEAGSAAAAQAAWRPIAGAPKDGTEVLLWREDCGQFIGSYVSADSFPLEQKEIDELTEEELFTHDWFTQWPDARRLEGSELPTLWQHLPAAPSATSVSEPQTKAARDVLAERQRQVSAEGWTPEHDDEHWEGDLSLAGAVYAVTKGPRTDVPPAWPWEADAFKPRDWRRNLIKAGALILAEIERLDRETSKKCVEPMCACRGGPCAECPEGQALAATPASPWAPAPQGVQEQHKTAGDAGAAPQVVAGEASEPLPACLTCGLSGRAIADERDAYATSQPQWKALAESLMGMIAEISDALGIDDESQETANGAGEILDRIAELKASVTPSPAPSSVTPEQRQALVRGLNTGKIQAPAPSAAPHQGADALREALAGDVCPLCGGKGLHKHSPEEIVIFRNGAKFARRQQDKAEFDEIMSASEEELDAMLRAEGIDPDEAAESGRRAVRAVRAHHQAPQQGEPK